MEAQEKTQISWETGRTQREIPKTSVLFKSENMDISSKISIHAVTMTSIIVNMLNLHVVYYFTVINFQIDFKIELIQIG